MMSATAFILAIASGTNDATGCSASHLARSSKNSVAFLFSRSGGVGLSVLRIADAKSRTLAAKLSSSIVYFMGLPFVGVLWNSQFKAAGSPTQSTTQGA